MRAARASRRPAIAVSGGPDSLCLALLALDWGDPLALIVDHALRPGSDAEAALTAGRLAAMGVPSRILTLRGLGRGPALAARARAARYGALIAATREAGRVDLLLGHHRRDQAETLLMRHAAGSGPAGLSAMARIVETEHVRLLRPLLDVPPGALRAMLREAGIFWVEDPSNHDTAALRTRLRDSLADPEGDAPRTAALAQQAAAHAAARAQEDRRIAAELADRAAIFPEAYALLTPGQISPASLGALIRALTGAPYAPAAAVLARLAAAPVPATLGGIALIPAGRLGPGLLMVREEAAMSPPIPAVPGALWDRRFRLEGDPPPGATIGALGTEASSLRGLTRLPAAVLRTLPAIRLQGVLVAVPHIGYRDTSGPTRMAVIFAPATPASGAPFGA
jgi:tRNA(Ile)-lysidine synthase